MPVNGKLGSSLVPQRGGVTGKYTSPAQNNATQGRSYRNNSSPSTGMNPTLGLTPVRSQKGGLGQRNTNSRFRTIDAAAHSTTMKKGMQNRTQTNQQRASRIQKQTSSVTQTQKIAHQSSSAPLKGGYILFFLVLGLAVGKDIFDVIITILDLAGTGLTATVIGSVIGIPLLVLAETIAKIVMLFIDGTIMFYFWFTGGKLGLRFVIMSIGAIMEAVPGLNILPLTTLTFVLAFLAGRVISKVESKVGGGLVTSAISKKI